VSVEAPNETVVPIAIGNKMQAMRPTAVDRFMVDSPFMTPSSTVVDRVAAWSRHLFGVSPERL
jgi:hypothetical protein